MAVRPADVYMLLADVSMENEKFAEALPDYETALDLLLRAKTVRHRSDPGYRAYGTNWSCARDPSSRS